MMFFKSAHNNKGFTMLEMIAAISLFSFGVLAVYGAFANINSVTNNVSFKLKAVYLAKEGFEIIRNIRDDNFINRNSNNWDRDIRQCDDGCQADYKTSTPAETNANKLKDYNDSTFLNQTADGLYSYDAGSTTTFKRKITVISEDKDRVKVTSEVFWEYNGKDYEFETMGYLYNWY